MNAFNTLHHKLAEITDIRGATALLSWDQEVMMPPGGAATRSRQTATLSGLAHETFIREIPALLAAAEQDYDRLSAFEQANLRQIRRDLDRIERIPTAHVVETSRAISEAFQSWLTAKKQADFGSFAPKLAELVRLKKAEAAYLGYEQVPYDALLDMHEPGLRYAQVQPLFDAFKPQLRALLDRIEAAPQVAEEFLLQPMSPADQLAFSEEILRKMGYDFNMGRQDLSEHPFSICFSPQDVRVTTRVQENDIREVLYSSIHEGGHALYEQGILMEHYGLPAGEYCSLGIHESQSRLWENNVGRSLEFWEHVYPALAQRFGWAAGAHTPEQVFRAVNRVQPSPIRISADELTYHFHIILRSEIEYALFCGGAEVGDLPGLWNGKMRDYLGITPADDAQGVLQDVHWSHGSFGYFPTYSIGSFYAAQFMEQAEKEIPDLAARHRAGDFRALREWLRKGVHEHGRCMTAEVLCKKLTGEALNVAYFVTYAEKKYKRVYQL